MGTNLITLLCGTMDSTARPGTTKADIDHCVDVLAPVVSSISMNYPPFLTNPVSAATAKPSQIIYQNADVKVRAQAGVARMDEQTRKHNRAARWKACSYRSGCRMTRGSMTARRKLAAAAAALAMTVTAAGCTSTASTRCRCRVPRALTTAPTPSAPWCRRRRLVNNAPVLLDDSTVGSVGEMKVADDWNAALTIWLNRGVKVPRVRVRDGRDDQRTGRRIWRSCSRTNPKAGI